MPTFCTTGQKAYLYVDGGPFVFDGPIDVSVESLPLEYMPNAPGAFTLYGRTHTVYGITPDGSNTPGWCFVHPDEPWRMPRAHAKFTAPRSGIASLIYGQAINSGRGNGVSVSGPKGGTLNLNAGDVILWEVDPLGNSNYDWNYLRLIVTYQAGGFDLLVKKNGVKIFTRSYPTAPAYTVKCGDRCPPGEKWDPISRSCCCENMPSLIAQVRGAVNIARGIKP